MPEIYSGAPPVHHLAHEYGGYDEILTDALPSQVSGILQNSNDAEKSTTSSTYVKKKETRIDEILQALTVKFDMKTVGGSTTAYGRIYKNGSGEGTVRSSVSETYCTFSENFSDLAEEDLLQLYLKDSGGEAFGKNLRFYYELDFQRDMTNQDP